METLADKQLSVECLLCARHCLRCQWYRSISFVPQTLIFLAIKVIVKKLRKYNKHYSRVVTSSLVWIFPKLFLKVMRGKLTGRKDCSDWSLTFSWLSVYEQMSWSRRANGGITKYKELNEAWSFTDHLWQGKNSERFLCGSRTRKEIAKVANDLITLKHQKHDRNLGLEHEQGTHKSLWSTFTLKEMKNKTTDMIVYIIWYLLYILYIHMHIYINIYIKAT